MRLALPLTIAALLAALLAGCGGSSSTDSSSRNEGPPAQSQSAPPGATSHACGDGQTLRVSAVPCDEAKAVLAAWRSAPACRIHGGASHASCKVRGYLCIAARQGDESAVSCARPGHSVLFVPPK